MTDTKDTFDPEVTIPALNNADEFADYSELRESFRIYPGEDGLKYKNLKLLGMGGMGIVYSAEDPTLERQVALKILREPFRNKRDQIAKFVNEARITARIDHPNIVSVHQLGVNEQRGVYFSMRRISGETLQNAIKRLREKDEEALRSYTLQRLLDIFIAGCNGVAAAHEKKVLHCDLKPANIMIGAFGEVLVLDWGLAREFGTPESQKDHISGTPAFMAPELITGSLNTPDEKTEVYALGTILYSIITWNQSPFDMTLSKEQLMEKIASGKTLPLRSPRGMSVPRELMAICRKAMASRRQKRYATVKELLQDLHNFHNGYPVKAYSPNIFYRFFKLCRRHPAIPIAVIVAVITLITQNLALRGLDYAHDRSLMRSSLINYRIANDYYQRSLIRRQKADFDQPDSLLKLVILEKNAAMQANLAIMEYLSIIDSASGFSNAGKREFADRYGYEIFRKMLNLKAMYGEPGEVEKLLSRCRGRDIFHMVLEKNEKLQRLVEMIDSGIGVLRLKNDVENCSERIAVVYCADGTQSLLRLQDETDIVLPVGWNNIIFDDGLKMRVAIAPGREEVIRVIAPLTSEENAVLIPADNFFMDIGDEGAIRCDLPEFLIRPQALDGEYDFEEAKKRIELINKDSQIKWRLPHVLEICKALNYDRRGTQENFYGVGGDSVDPVLLSSGEIFDPVNGKILENIPGGKGKVYLVSDITQAIYD